MWYECQGCNEPVSDNEPHAVIEHCDFWYHLDCFEEDELEEWEEFSIQEY
jgi:hypothetical protein